MIGWKELLFIAIAVVILFGGASQLPKIMRSLGEGLREFKKSVKEVKKNAELNTDTNTDTDTDTISDKDDPNDPAKQA